MSTPFPACNDDAGWVILKPAPFNQICQSRATFRPMGAGVYYRIGDPSMDTADLCIEQTNDVVVATAMTQDLTEPEATELVDELIGCIRYDAAHFFVLNLGQVQRITSSAIQALLILFQELEHVRGRVVLTNCQPNVESVFETTRLDALFELYEDIDEAVEAVTP